ncbi:MAG: peptide-methionine (R)-S-oxide reductase MsrB [Gammaproteobacteria bacterium]|nr:peptide-methionine (R)-S-oxide reductase MsrB [Gammaproteobacteria bacterium]
MKRRTLLQHLAISPGAVLLTQAVQTTQAKTGGTNVENLQKNWKSYLAEDADVALVTEPLNYSEEKWKEMLTPQQYEILRREGTERPFHSPLNGEKRPGVYVCTGCSLPLFTSAMKFDSGTGWPSFFTTIPGAFETKKDFKLIWPRTEYHCARCKGHHGHVFNDGPPPTGERWCNNGAALRFIHKA